MPAWVEQGVNEYSKRLPPEIKFEIKEIPLGKRGKGADLKRAIAAEGQQMLALIPKADKVIALEVRGSAWGTEKLARELKSWHREGDNITLLVGGPDGLARECQARANQQWSLSALTLPHPLVRIVLAEQLYRAWAINNNHPYHR